MNLSVCQPIRIAALLGLESKVNRDRFCGILRYSIAKANWEIRTYTREEIQTTISMPVRDCKALWVPDAIIMVGDNETYRQFVRFCQKLRRKPLPCIFLDINQKIASRKSIGTVTTDDGAIARTAADFFLKRHFQNFAYVGTRDHSELWHSKIRQSAFLRELAKAKHTAAVFQLYDSAARRQQGLQALSEFLSELSFPCALFAYSDEVARIVLDACHFANLRVPEQLSILGVDDQTEITENTRPSLSSILPDFELSGFRAAEMLDSLLTDSPHREHPRAAIISEIIGTSERASTQDTRGRGRIVSLALEYIRLHYASRLHTEDIAAKLNVSARLIEKSFREILGCTVHGKITELRINKALKLMAHKDMSRQQIADSCGYQTVDGLNLALHKRQRRKQIHLPMI